jgi:transposase
VDTPEGAKMRQELFMAKRKRRAFTPEFKADAVKLVKAGRSVPDVARELDLTDTALREWVRRAEIDAGNGPPGALTTAERKELTKLRREVKRLQMERDILKAAATFFAKESEWSSTSSPRRRWPSPSPRCAACSESPRAVTTHASRARRRSGWRMTHVSQPRSPPLTRPVEASTAVPVYIAS